MIDMNTEKCRLLLQVIQAGSFSSAAERLGYTPSGVMRSIASLEKEIGFPLLGRTAQGIYLTREGQAVLPYLRRLIRDEDALLQYSAQIRGLTAGDIYIGSYFSVAANCRRSYRLSSRPIRQSTSTSRSAPIK